MSTTVKSALIPLSRQREKPGQPLKWIGKNIKRSPGRAAASTTSTCPTCYTRRCAHARARRHRVDRRQRRTALKGVVKVLTGADIAWTTGPPPCFSNPPAEQRCVAVCRVRHVGEAVAVVVAESRHVAEDALDLIAVEYEDLPVMSDPEEAVKATGDGVLHPERGPTNVAMQRRFTFGPVATKPTPPGSSGAGCAGRCSRSRSNRRRQRRVRERRGGQVHHPHEQLDAHHERLRRCRKRSAGAQDQFVR